MLDQYFRDELAYLRESGSRFAKRNPKLARYLAESSTDPDVERMLEGFAFLTSRLRAKLDDELPELNHAIIQLLWPNLLRVFPATALAKLSPKERSITERQTVPRHMQMRSGMIDGIECEFKTTTECTIYPMEIHDIQLARSQKKSSLFLTIQTISGLPLEGAGLDDLRLWFTGDDSISQALYVWMGRYLKSVKLHFKDDTPTRNVDLNLVAPGGFGDDEGILANTSVAFSGYRLLQEYFAFPDKFLCFDLKELGPHFRGVQTDKFEIELEFERSIPAHIHVRPNNISLYCVPIVNLFSMASEPLLMNQKRMHYPVKPSGYRKDAFRVFSVDEVFSLQSTNDDKGQRLANTYPLFESFDHEVDSDLKEGQIYYRLRTESNPTDKGLDYTISFVHHDSSHVIPPEESISIGLTCCNGNIPHELGVGDICFTTEDTDSFFTFENITRPTEMTHPPTDGRLYWNMISNLSLNYKSLLDKDALTAIISVYDFRAQFDRQSERATQRRMDAIGEIETAPADKLFKGHPLRGLKTKITFDEEKFQSEGDMYLFASVLAEFFSLYSSINSFHELEAEGKHNGEIYQWPTKFGRQPLI